MTKDEKWALLICVAGFVFSKLYIYLKLTNLIRLNNFVFLEDYKKEVNE